MSNKNLSIVHQALGLLSSMVNGGERHSVISEEAVAEAHAVLDSLESCTDCETREHIDRVRSLMRRAADQLIDRGVRHDRSKLEEPEAEGFAKCTHTLKGLTYGSEEYKEQLKEMQPFLKHHYEHNAHHPEHWDNGISDMTLMDLIEMLCDWAAATERHDDGCLAKSLHLNHARFEIPRLIQEQLICTAWELFHDKMSAHEEGKCKCPTKQL